MKKVLSVLLAGALVVSTLAGCGSTQSSTPDSDGSAQNTGGDNAEKTTLVLWMRDRADASFIQPRVDKYNETSKDGIFTGYQMYTDSSKQALDMTYSTNNGPNLVGTSGMTNIFIKYVNQEQRVEIDQCLTDEQRTRYKSLASNGIGAIGGKPYCIPVFDSTSRLFYNEGVFEKYGIEKLPKTVTELTQTAKVITDKLKGEGVYGFAMNLKSPSSALQRSINFIVQRSGGSKQGHGFGKEAYDFSMYEGATKEFRTVFAAGITFPDCESLDIGPLHAQFMANKVGMCISWSHADPGVYASQFPTNERWNVVRLPAIDGKMYSQSIQPYKGYMVTKTCKAPGKTWKARNDMFYSDDFVKVYHEAGLGSVMVDDLKSQVRASEILKGKESGPLGTTGKFWPATPQKLNSQAVIIEDNDQYTDLAGIILGTSDVKAGLAALTDRYNATLKKGIQRGEDKELKIANWDPINPDG